MFSRTAQTNTVVISCTTRPAVKTKLNEVGETIHDTKRHQIYHYQQKHNTDHGLFVVNLTFHDISGEKLESNPAIRLSGRDDRADQQRLHHIHPITTSQKNHSNRCQYQKSQTYDPSTSHLFLRRCLIHFSKEKSYLFFRLSPLKKKLQKKFKNETPSHSRVGGVLKSMCGNSVHRGRCEQLGCTCVYIKVLV